MYRSDDLQEADRRWVQEGPLCRREHEFSSMDSVSFRDENAHWPKSKESNEAFHENSIPRNRCTVSGKDA